MTATPDPSKTATAGGIRDRIARALAEITVGHRAFVTVDVEAEYPRADAALAALLAPHRPELSWEGRAEHAIGLYTRTAIELEDARREAAELRALVAELTDDGPCQYDHKGQCQAHGLHYAPCPHARAQRLLTEIANPAPKES